MAPISTEREREGIRIQSATRKWGWNVLDEKTGNELLSPSDLDHGSVSRCGDIHSHARDWIPKLSWRCLMMLSLPSELMKSFVSARHCRIQPLAKPKLFHNVYCRIFLMWLIKTTVWRNRLKTHEDSTQWWIKPLYNCTAAKFAQKDELHILLFRCWEIDELIKFSEMK